MNTNTVTTNIHEASKIALEATKSHESVRQATLKAVIDLEALPRTPTGRITKSTQRLIDETHAKCALAGNDAHVKLTVVRDLLVQHAKEYNKACCAPALIDSVMKDNGFEPLDQGLKERLISSSDKLIGSNTSYIRENKESHQNTFIYNTDAVYISKDAGSKSVVVIGFNDEDGYCIRYAGKAQFVDCSIGTILSANGRDFSLFDHVTLGSGMVNISSIGAQTEDDCIERLSRMTTFIRLSKCLRIAAPVVNMRSVGFDSIVYAGRVGLEILECLVQGKAIISAIRTHKDGVKTTQVCSSMHVEEGVIPVGIIIPESK